MPSRSSQASTAMGQSNRSNHPGISDRARSPSLPKLPRTYEVEITMTVKMSHLLRINEDAWYVPCRMFIFCFFRLFLNSEIFLKNEKSIYIGITTIIMATKLGSDLLQQDQKRQCRKCTKTARKSFFTQSWYRFEQQCQDRWYFFLGRS